LRQPLGSYGRDWGKKTAKNYAALRHEPRRVLAKNNAAFRLEGGISCAGLSRFIPYSPPARPVKTGLRHGLRR